MSEYILNALENYGGISICYTGGRLCGKSTYATLMAISLKKEEGHAVAALDFNSSAAFTKNCNDLDIPIISTDRLCPLSLWDTLNKYQAIVIDLPLSSGLPIALLKESSRTKAMELNYPESRAEYCRRWYHRFFLHTTYALFTLPYNDSENHGSDALSFLQKNEISTQGTGLVYFRSLSQTGSKVTPRIDILLQQLSLLQTVSHLTFGEHYLRVIHDAIHDNSNLLTHKEYRDHYTSILSSTFASYSSNN